MGPHFAVEIPVTAGQKILRYLTRTEEKSLPEIMRFRFFVKRISAWLIIGCHTDITIPYEELGSIRVIDEDGEGTSIIENGRFVLPGTEELNRPFEK